VYVSLRDEIVAMAGQDVYDLLASYLGTRQGRGVSLLAHPTVREHSSNASAGNRPI
jgi:hypothetical protein